MAEFQERRTEVGFAREIVTPDDAPLGVRLLQEGLGSLRGAIGTPDQVADLIQRYEAAGVDQVIFVSQAGANRHEHICESLELFAAEVLPRFAERAPSASAPRASGWRARWSGRWRGAAPARVADPDYVVKPDREPAPARRAAARRGAAGTALRAPVGARAGARPRRRPSQRWFAVAATSSSTASSTAGPGWR